MKLLLLAAVAAIAAAQTAPAIPTVPAAAPSFLTQISDPLFISMAAYDVSQVASGTTAWHFTLAGKQYTVNPATRTGIAAASTLAVAAIAHKWPKLKTPATIGLAIAAAYYSGRAYYNAQNHGAP